MCAFDCHFNRLHNDTAAFSWWFALLPFPRRRIILGNGFFFHSEGDGTRGRDGCNERRPLLVHY